MLVALKLVFFRATNVLSGPMAALGVLRCSRICCKINRLGYEIFKFDSFNSFHSAILTLKMWRQAPFSVACRCNSPDIERGMHELEQTFHGAVRSSCANEWASATAFDSCIESHSRSHLRGRKRYSREREQFILDSPVCCCRPLTLT